MADEYGFFSAAKVGLALFENGQRGSGRTTRLLERVRDGDQIVVDTVPLARFIERELRRLEKTKVVVIVVAARSGEFYKLRKGSGRLFFEHTWVENFVKYTLGEAEFELIAVHKALSHDEQPRTDPGAERMVDFAFRTS